MKFFEKLFKSDAGNSPTSRNVAKERLKLALTYDRAGLPQGTIEQLRDEIIQVITKHLAVNSEDVDIHLDRGADYEKLIASVPLWVVPRSRRKGASATLPTAATEAPESVSTPPYTE